MNCPKCSSNNNCKDGFVLGRQRYLCKNCRRRYSVNKKSDVKSIETRKLALQMYLEGLGFRAIGRVLGINYATVYYWVKEWGSKVSLPKSDTVVEVIELDEMHTYVGSKKTTVGYGLLLIDIENGTSRMCVGAEEPKQA